MSENHATNGLYVAIKAYVLALFLLNILLQATKKLVLADNDRKKLLYLHAEKATTLHGFNWKGAGVVERAALEMR